MSAASMTGMAAQDSVHGKKQNRPMRFDIILNEIGRSAAGPDRHRTPRLAGALLLVLVFCCTVSGCTVSGGPDTLNAADKSDSKPEFAESGQSAEFEEFDEFNESDKFSEFEKFDEFGQQTDEARRKIRDPLSGYNRFMTKVNDKIYFWVLKPAATGYSAVTPRFVRRSANRFFKNLGFPIRFVNNVLQLKAKRAGVETGRFLINSTVGLAGLADPADRWFDLEAYPEDFGQTLGVYGVGPGFHIVLPVLGPSNLRDALALVPDGYMKPTYYVEPAETAIALKAYNSVNYTSLHLGEYEGLKKDAVDWYIFLRNAYETNRQKKIEE